MPPKKKPKLKKAKPTPKLSQVQTVTVNVGAQEKPKRKRKPRAKKAASVAPSLGLVAPSQEQGFARYIYPTQTQQDNSLITNELKAYLKQIHGGKPADNLQIEPQAPEQPSVPALPAALLAPPPPKKPEITLLSTRIRPKVKIDNPPVEDDDDDDAASVAGSVRDIAEDDLSGFGKGRPSKAKQNLGAAAEAPPVEQSPEKPTLDNIVSPGKTRAPRRSKAQMEADKAMDEQKKEEKRIAREVKAAAAEAAKEEKRKEKKLSSIREE
jgi:mRNA-degrading endonuclease toxin of MazEF toxin-antitoxin module